MASRVTPARAAARSYAMTAATAASIRRGESLRSLASRAPRGVFPEHGVADVAGQPGVAGVGDSPPVIVSARSPPLGRARNRCAVYAADDLTGARAALDRLLPLLRRRADPRAVSSGPHRAGLGGRDPGLAAHQGRFPVPGGAEPSKEPPRLPGAEQTVGPGDSMSCAGEADLVRVSV
jgi:hypothetical protein